MIRHTIPTAMLGVLLGLACSACGRTGPENPGGGSLLRIESEPAGTNCPEGGLAVLTGLDQDEDGVLDDWEVASTDYVCNGQSGENGQDGQDGHSTLIDTADEPPGANCPTGGLLISTGLDLDDDGVLEPEEATATEYVCNGEDGEDGLASLVSVMDEAAGANCTEGGQAVRSGVDSNRDGLLQPEEVTATDYVCNGATGADGQPGLTSLVRQEDAAPGDCPFEGRVVMTGLDEDGDGYLDDEEVRATSYVCNGEPGAPGHASLFELLDEPAGANCPSGGTQVQTGLDTNDDGVLDPGEVMATNYVCDGGNLALRVSNAEWGGVCQRGGVKVETGVDDNGNCVLDEPEVDQTQYVCNLFPVQIDSGSYHTCAIVSDGTAWCWGRNVSGQVGDGTTIHCPLPVTVSGLAHAVEISAGYGHSCALLTDGTVQCWGLNQAGQLGDGTPMSSLTPVAVSGLALATSISAGQYHTCSVLSDGTARCWGANWAGQIGDGANINRYTPAVVTGLSQVAGISAGWENTCAFLVGGSALCWGTNTYGQLGDGTTISSLVPVWVSGLTQASGVSASLHHACAVLADGTARCWGRNQEGQLGDGTYSEHWTPVVVAGLSQASRISTGERHSCALLMDGTARCWGGNSGGQLGDGTSTDRPIPVAVGILTQTSAISAGESHTCALVSDGTAYCWGRNDFGQLGDGTILGHRDPTLVQWAFAP
ncbi:MAG TPA: hypothetical protein PK668_23185 [Myxococcota bacterium]|nr:hypothetical protein [Myxococcota bacterium]HRY95600.1 hypothetical protein [Myxococcota bacterium]